MQKRITEKQNTRIIHVYSYQNEFILIRCGEKMRFNHFEHIEPRRGTLKRFKNGGKCLLNFSK